MSVSERHSRRASRVKERPTASPRLSYFGAATQPAHVRIIARRVRRLMPRAQIVACFWMLGEEPDKLEAWRKAVGADVAAASLRSAAEQILAAARAASRTPVHA